MRHASHTIATIASAGQLLLDASMLGSCPSKLCCFALAVDGAMWASHEPEQVRNNGCKPDPQHMVQRITQKGAPNESRVFVLWQKVSAVYGFPTARQLRSSNKVLFNRLINMACPC